MKKEYDFSKGERGKFFRADAAIQLPVYLDPQVQDYLSERASAKGVSLETMVNDLLRKEIDIVEAVK